MYNRGMIDRDAHRRTVTTLLRDFPVVAILGARQVGKSTLAMQIMASHRGPAERFDLEDPADLARLDDASLALSPLRGLVVLDEVQRRADLFPVLRVLADRRPRPARFLVLGSASPELLRQSSETLAGRIAFHTLDGFCLAETGADTMDRLWLRGGFPGSFLARSEAAELRVAAPVHPHLRRAGPRPARRQGRGDDDVAVLGDARPLPRADLQRVRARRAPSG